MSESGCCGCCADEEDDHKDGILKRSIPMKKTHGQRLIQLYNRHGYNLCIFPGGYVRGTRDAFNPYAVLEILSVEVGEVMFRGVETDLFLAMNSSGKLEGWSRVEEHCRFVEKIDGRYISYLSRRFAYYGWHIAIKRNGKVKHGRDTWHPFRQKAVQFLHRNPYAAPHPLKQMMNKHGHKLSILPSGEVQGSKDDFNSFAVLEFSPGPDPGTLRIRGVETNRYLAMSGKGRLYTDHSRLNPDTLFVEHMNGNHLVYLSYRYSHKGWKVAISKAGQPKAGWKTTFPLNQKATLWTAVDVADSVDTAAQAKLDEILKMKKVAENGENNRFL